MVKQKYLFKTLATLLIGSIYLLVVFRNLPSVLHMYNFWLLGWFTALLLFYPKIFISKHFWPVYFYIFLFFTLFNTIWVDIGAQQKRFIWDEIISVFSAISIMTYFIEERDFKGVGLVVLFSLLFIAVTLITSIIGLETFPIAARNLAGPLASAGRFNIIKMYNKIGIGGYGFFAGITFIIPVLLGQVKMPYYSRKNKALMIIGLILIFYTFIQSQYMANISIGVFILIFAMFGLRRYKNSIVISIIIILLFSFIPVTFWIILLERVALIFKDKLMDFKIYDLISYLSGRALGNTGIDTRVDRVPMLIDNFLENPLFGIGKGNGHLHWLNKLSMYGLIGTIPFFVIIYSYIKYILKFYPKNYKFYYILAIAAYLILGSIKSLLGNEISYSFFFIVPGIYFLKYLKKNNANYIVT